MLRSLFGKVAAGGVAAGAAAPTTSHCRAQSQHRGNAGLKTRTSEGVQTVDQQWQVADICNGDIIFNPEEISEVINTVLGVPDRDAAPVVTSDVAIHEIDGDGQDQSDSDSSAADANDAIAAADMQVAHMYRHGQFTATLNNMLNRPDVQKVLLKALLDDPNMQDVLQDRNYAAGGDLLLPPAARAGLLSPDVEVTDVEDVTEEEAAAVRAAKQVAATILNAARSLQQAAADTLIKLGYEIHSLLGRPFKRPAKTSGEAADGAQGDRADLLPRLLMIVGVAVMALLVFKRLHVAA